MAGGMNRRRGDHGTLADRAAVSREPENPIVPPPPPGPDLVPVPQVKHCWVNGDFGRLPGLLLSWEQRAGGWHGRVVHPIREGEAWHVVEEWLPAAKLEAGS